MVKRLRKLCIFYGLFRCYFAGGLLFLVYRIRKEDSILFKHSAVFYKSRKTFYQKEEARKKKIAMLLSSLLVVSMLSGCGSEATVNTESNVTTTTENQNTQTTEPVNITVWHCVDATIADTLQKQVDALAPETTDELLELMKNETTADQYVFVEQHSTSYNAAAWIQGFGGYLINENREPGLNLPQTVEAMEYHKQFVSYMPTDGEYNTVTTLFTEGKAASTIGGPWLVPGIKEAGIDLGIAPMPVLPNGTSLTPFSGVQGVHVLKHAAETKKEALAEVLKVLGSKETGVALANAASCAPANSKAYEDASVSEDQMIMALKTMANNVVPMPNIPEMDVMWSVTDDLLAAVNKRGEDVQTACDAHQKEALEQISAMQ